MGGLRGKHLRDDIGAAERGGNVLWIRDPEPGPKYPLGNVGTMSHPRHSYRPMRIL